MKVLKTILIVTFVLFIYNLNGQLVVTGLHENSEIRQYLKTHKGFQTKMTIDTLELPFFDDFTTTKVYPDTARWIDRNVFVNNSMPDYPLNFNVATFDAISDTGLLYGNASTNEFIADYLTSKPIDLGQYTPADSIYLSFYYQPQGNAMDYPDEDDSLVLEFTTPDTSTWFHIWSVAGSSNQPFEQVMIPITNPVFFTKGFSFRFKNYATLGDPLKPSWQSNCDFWHIDLVYLDAGRTHADTIINDVGVLYILDGERSFINDFETIPWNHYMESNIQPYSTISLTYRNISDTAYNITSEYYMINVFDEDTFAYATIGAENIFEFSDYTYTKGITQSPMFPHNTKDSARFEIRANLVGHASIDSMFYVNDTISYFQSFYNFYAYDDGIPEYGYGVHGNNSENGMLCIQYCPYQADTLTAVQIFFNHTNENITKYFILNVWDNNNGEPGDLLYTTDDGIEAYYDGLNRFHNYLLDTILVVSDTFYIGWQKVNTREMMNVGIDINRDVKEKVFYKISPNGNWDTSPYTGAPMIRPVFRSNYLVSKEEVNCSDNNIVIYPNPTDDQFYVQGIEKDDLWIKVYDISGNLVLNDRKQEAMSVKDLPDGIYYVHITNNKTFSTTKKLVVIR